MRKEASTLSPLCLISSSKWKEAYYDSHLTSGCISQFGSEPPERKWCNYLAPLYLNETATPQGDIITRPSTYLFNYNTSALRNVNLHSLSRAFWSIVWHNLSTALKMCFSWDSYRCSNSPHFLSSRGEWLSWPGSLPSSPNIKVRHVTHPLQWDVSGWRGIISVPQSLRDVLSSPLVAPSTGRMSPKQTGRIGLETASWWWPNSGPPEKRGLATPTLQLEK